MSDTTPADRIRAAFEHRPTSTLPIHHVGFSSYAGSLILGREAYVGGGIQRWRESVSLWNGPDAHAEFLARSLQDALDLNVAVNNDMLRNGYWRFSHKPTQRIDENTFLYGDPDGEFFVTRFDPDTEMFQEIDRQPPPKEPTFEDIERDLEAQEAALEEGPPPSAELDEGDTAAYARWGDKYALSGAGLWTGFGYERIWMEAIALRPDLAARRMDYNLAKGLQHLEAQKELPVHYLKGGGDFASNHGPFYSPRAFHEIVFPRLRRYCDEAHKLGKYYLFASDGDLWSVADDLFGAGGTDGYFEIDRRAGMDLRRLRERFPDLTLLGNVSSHMLHTGTLDQVKAECRDVCETAMELGSIIAGVSNYPQIGTPPENLFAMLEIFAEYR